MVPKSLLFAPKWNDITCMTPFNKMHLNGNRTHNAKLNNWGKAPLLVPPCCRTPMLLSGSQLFPTFLCIYVSATLLSTLHTSAHLPSEQFHEINTIIFNLILHMRQKRHREVKYSNLYKSCRWLIQEMGLNPGNMVAESVTLAMMHISFLTYQTW